IPLTRVVATTLAKTRRRGRVARLTTARRSSREGSPVSVLEAASPKASRSSMSYKAGNRPWRLRLSEMSHFAVSAVGADRPGIVHQVTSLLAEQSINVVDLSTRVIGDADRPVYAMLIDVTIPPDVDPTQLTAGVRALAGELGVECSLHPADADI